MIRPSLHSLLLTLFFMFLTFVNVDAQEEEYYEVEIESDLYEEVGRVFLAEFNLDVSDPIGTFNDYMENPGFGVSLAAYMQTKPTSASFWGLDFRYQQFHRVSNTYEELIDGVYYTYDGQASVNLMNLSLKYRYYPNVSLWRIEPYVEGGVGFNWWFTYFSARDIEFEDDFTSSFENGEISMSYALGTGIQIQLSDMTYLNFRTEYSPGNTTEYNARNDLEDFGNPLEAYTLRKTTTDLVRYVLGVTLAF